MTTSAPTFILDFDAIHLNALQSHLSRYILRNKVKIEETRHQIVQAWGPSSSRLWGNYVPDQVKGLPLGSLVPRNGFVEMGCRDTRHSQLGIRFVLEPEHDKGISLLSHQKSHSHHLLPKKIQMRTICGESS